MTVTKIEIDFAVPVDLTDEQQRQIFGIVQTIAHANIPEGCVHWAAGCGSKPNFNKADAPFLRKPVDPDAPETGEPTWDDSVFHIETCCRERYENEN